MNSLVSLVMIIVTITVLALLIAFFVLRNYVNKKFHTTQKLMDRYQKLEMMVENSPVSAYIVQNEKFVYANQGMLRMLGYSRAEWESKDFYEKDIVETESLQKVKEIRSIDKELRGIRIKIKRKDGDSRYLEVYSTESMYNGRPARVGHALDITEKVLMEQALEKSDYFLHEAQRIGHIGNWEADLIHDQVYWSEEAQRIFGVSHLNEPFTSRHYYERIHPDDYQRVLSEIEAALKKKEPFTLEHRIIRPDGVERTIHEKVDVMYDQQGNPIRTLGTIQDITEQRKIEAELIKSEYMFQTLFSLSKDLVFAIDLAGRIMMMNPMGEQVLGYKKGELMGQFISTFIVERDRRKSIIAFEQALNGDGQPLELRAIHKSGKLIDLEASVIPIKINEQITGIIGIARDVTEHKKYEELIREMAYQDSLTKLANRDMYMERLAEEIAKAGNRGGQLVVLYLDLDRFKIVNDTLGHDAGDKVLQMAASRLDACLQEHEMLARLGGDEFAAIVTGIDCLQRAKELSQEFIRALEPSFILQGQSFSLGCSLGMALYPEHGSTPETLLKHADQAMYEVKRRGKNSYYVYSPSADLSEVKQNEGMDRTHI